MRASVALMTAVLLCTGCSSGWESPAPTPQPKQTKQAAVVSLHIPPGHYPPPGMCRVWLPGRPPGHQPKAVSCASAIRNVPLGAWVIHRPKGRKDPLEVTFYDDRRAGIVVDLRYYDPDSGVLLQGEVMTRR